MSRPGDLSVESRIPDAVQKALQTKGHKLQSAGAWSLGSNAAIAIDPKTGAILAEETQKPRQDEILVGLAE
jgi:hypothetical protein